MDLNEYAKFVSRTSVYRGPCDEYASDAGDMGHIGNPNMPRIVYVGLGLASEAGEVAGEIKKVLRNNNGSVKQRRNLILDEASDVLWYLQALCNELEAH